MTLKNNTKLKKINTMLKKIIIILSSENNAKLKK